MYHHIQLFMCQNSASFSEDIMTFHYFKATMAFRQFKPKVIFLPYLLCDQIQI